MTRPRPITLPEIFFAAGCCWFGGAFAAASRGPGGGLATADVLTWTGLACFAVALAALVARALVILAECLVDTLRPDRDGAAEEDRL